MLTEINFAALVSVDENVGGKEELEKIVLIKVPTEIYPTLYETFVYLFSQAGIKEISIEKEVNFEKLYNERSKELCFEYGDRFLNTRRVKKDIVAENGNGTIAYSTYNELLVYPIPQSEIDIHNLKR